jgi:hypothetical protein
MVCDEDGPTPTLKMSKMLRNMAALSLSCRVISQGGPESEAKSTTITVFCDIAPDSGDFAPRTPDLDCL